LRPRVEGSPGRSSSRGDRGKHDVPGIHSSDCSKAARV
jgi:hypothetical protein